GCLIQIGSRLIGVGNGLVPFQPGLLWDLGLLIAAAVGLRGRLSGGTSVTFRPRRGWVVGCGHVKPPSPQDCSTGWSARASLRVVRFPWSLSLRELPVRSPS